MKKHLIILCLAVTPFFAGAQQFLNEGMVEYEVRVNNHKAFGDGIWAEMFKDKIPQFSTSYYHLTFANNQGFYKLDHRDERTKLPFDDGSADEDVWYSDYRAGTYTDQKAVFGDTYLLSDSLMKIDWKLSPTETREIAGFNCRKATGILFDSVYVFAFYTDEITVSGGPMGLHGLPGMILGVTIPRMFTSWIATKLEVNGVNTRIVTPPTKGKKRKAQELRASAEKATSDWGQWGQMSIWNIFL